MTRLETYSLITCWIHHACLNKKKQIDLLFQSGGVIFWITPKVLLWSEQQLFWCLKKLLSTIQPSNKLWNWNFYLCDIAIRIHWPSFWPMDVVTAVKYTTSSHCPSLADSEPEASRHLLWPWVCHFICWQL